MNLFQNGKKKIYPFALSAFAMVLLLTALYMACFFSPGIHFFLDAVHIDTQRDCYLIDQDTGTVSGRITVTVRGTGRKSLYDFDGEIEVPGYENSEGNIYTACKIREMQNGSWCITEVNCNEISYSENGRTRYTFEPCTYYQYSIFLRPRDPAFFHIWITGPEADIYAVFAESEAAAVETYKAARIN